MLQISRLLSSQRNLFEIFLYYFIGFQCIVDFIICTVTCCTPVHHVSKFDSTATERMRVSYLNA